MKKTFTRFLTALALFAFFIPMGVKAAEGDVHDMSITQSTNLNNNAAIPSIEIDAQTYPVNTVTINWRYNKAIENPVTIEVIVGDENWGTQTITGNITADAVFEGESTYGAITINFTNNTGSGTGHGTFYVNSVKLTEGEGGGPAPTTYTVTYHANVSGVEDIEETYNEGATVTIADNTFSNPGYAFTEWNTEADGNGDSYAPGDEIEDIDDDLELYAQWEESSSTTYTYNFAGANNFYTDAALTTNPSSGSGNNVETIYYSDGSAFTASGTNRYFSSASSGYFMLGKTGAQISLPTFEGYKITQVIVHTSGSVSTNVQVSVVSGSHTVSAAQKWATNSDFTYDIATDYQTSELSLNVTNNYNSQFTSIQLVCEVDVPSTDPTIVASDVDITYDAISGSIAYTIENEPTPAGTLSASTTANWLTLGTATATTVPFTCTENDEVVSRTATVTLTYTYGNNLTTKDIIVTQGVDETLGTADNPYTVAQARTFIDGLNGATSTEKYVSGIISQIDSYNSNYSSITYWISDDGTTTDQLEVYSGKGINGANFSSINDVELTAEVVVKGNLKKYNTTYEFDKSNELVVYNAPQHDVEAPTFSPEAGTYSEEQTVTLSCATETSTIFYTIDGTDPVTSTSHTQYENPITVSSTTTIKAVAVMGQYTSTVATANYFFCSEGDPYTVTEALSFAEYQYPANGIYVSGIVSTAPTAAPTNSGQLTYFISVDGEAENQLEVYKGLGLNEAAFTAKDDIQVGDIVTVYGNVVIYGTSNPIKEFAQGNYLVSFERPTPVVEDYDLTVEPFENLELITFVNDEMVMEEDGTVQVTNGSQVMLSIVADEGYVIATLMVNGVDHAGDIDDEFTYTFEMPAENVTISATAVEYVAPTTEDYELYSGALVEGDYVIYYNGYALKNEQLGTTGRLAYETVTPENNVIAADATIVWHIAPSATEDYWTIYSADAQAYAASTGVKNKAQMLAELDDDNYDMALWSVTVADNKDNTYEFVNKYNYAAQVNHLLRNNGTNGFACYAPATGGTLSLYKKVEAPVVETYTLTINGYNSQTTGWNLIASPVSTTPDQVGNMFNNTYNLYRFNQSAEAEWENYNAHENSFTITPGQGYLYANSELTTLEFSGDIYDGDGTIYLTYDDDAPHAAMIGWNLVGNPFAANTTVDKDFYIMNEAGSGIVVPSPNQQTVVPMQGIFVQATTPNDIAVTFTPISKGERSNSTESVVLNLKQDGKVIDRAIVRFNSDRQMTKFQLFEGDTKIFFPMEDADYAIVSSNGEGTMPVNFKAARTGKYTISVETEGIDMSYLHIIDRLTGEDVNVLLDNEYSFIASQSDVADRFILSFNENGFNAGADETFAFQNGSDVIVNGNGELQVFDVTGRMVMNTQVNGVQSVNMPNGVYVFRMIGETVNTQKIVVR